MKCKICGQKKQVDALSVCDSSECQKKNNFYPAPVNTNTNTIRKYENIWDKIRVSASGCF